MTFAIILVTIISVISLLGTILVSRNVDTQYGKSIKKNLTNLSLIYLLLFVILLVGITWYIVIVL
ncbi:hypothetical protein [Ectobacillus funiculus]|uniref:BshB3 potential contributor to bacillithiol synthesis n=1 Tax=Ectobacillus funiculus TaxID=137993 RepID=A0ABV5WE75_9BACI